MPKRIRTPKGIVGADERFDNSKFFLEHGIDLEKRTISIYEDIDEKVAAKVVRGIKKMLEINNNANDEKSKIDIEVGTNGGDAYYAFAIYNAIIHCPVIVSTHAQGIVASSGTLIYLAGDERYSDDDVTFMCHSASIESFGGKHFTIKIEADELDRLNHKFYEKYEEHTSKDKKWWAKKLEFKDFYFDYDEAQDLGFITHEYERED